MTEKSKQHSKQTLSTYIHVAYNIYGIYLLYKFASNLLVDSANDCDSPHVHTYFTLCQGMWVYITYDLSYALAYIVKGDNTGNTRHNDVRYIVLLKASWS